MDGEGRGDQRGGSDLRLPNLDLLSSPTLPP